MKKKYAPHEPEEEVLSAAEAIQDAEESEARWADVRKRPKNLPGAC